MKQICDLEPEFNSYSIVGTFYSKDYQNWEVNWGLPRIEKLMENSGALCLVDEIQEQGQSFHAPKVSLDRSIRCYMVRPM